MHKRKIIEELARSKKSSSNFTYQDIIKLVPTIEPTDKIYINHDPGFYSDNNSWDENYTLIVKRERDQTDEEYAELIQFIEDVKVKSKFDRYEQYLQLKGEFMDQPIPEEPLWNKDELHIRSIKKRSK